MKAFTKILTVIATLGLLVISCKPDQSVEPKHEGTPDKGLVDTHVRPEPQCMESVFAPLIEQGTQNGFWEPYQGIPWGSAELANDPDEIFILVTMGYGLGIAEGRIFANSTCANVPLNPDGSVNPEGYQYGGNTTFVTSKWQQLIPRSQVALDANQCACFSVYLEGGHMSIWGDLEDIYSLWAYGNPLGTNGYSFNACPVECPWGSTGAACFQKNSSGCSDLTAVTTDGTPPFTFTWSDGDIVTGTATGTYTKTVCPTGPGPHTYSVSITDSRSIYTHVLTYSVGAPGSCCSVPRPHPGDNLSAWKCGNESNGELKVKVCHLPPGNWQNMQEICIAVSALPAHIIDFKAIDKPCEGHNSGCHIGPCDPCGPGSTAAESRAAALAWSQQNNCPGN